MTYGKSTIIQTGHLKAFSISKQLYSSDNIVISTKMQGEIPCEQTDFLIIPFFILFLD